MADHEKLSEALRARLAELRGRSEAIEDDLRHHLDADSSEQAIDLADDEALAGVDGVIRGEIHDIMAALARIDSGTYGLCSSCGETIAPERLAALPTAGRCLKCA